MLGVDSHVPPTFASCNNDINAGFHAADDSLRASTAQIGALLERGVRVLIYVGTYGACAAGDPAAGLLTTSPLR